MIRYSVLMARIALWRLHFDQVGILVASRMINKHLRLGIAFILGKDSAMLHELQLLLHLTNEI